MTQSLRQRLKDKATWRRRDRLVIWLAWKLPRRLAYWVFIRVATYDYQFDPGGRTVSHALDCWDGMANEQD